MSIKMLLRTVTPLFVTALTVEMSSAQSFNSSNIFAHNDYEKEVPFFAAYDRQVGYIEADVHLVNGKLLVAHEKTQLTDDKSLENLYLQPLQEKISLNKGNVYSDAKRSLALMIDIKTEGQSTLNAIVELLNKYPSLTGCKTLNLTMSGDMPTPRQWSDYPSFVKFDGRPGVTYTEEQWKRITLVSASFAAYSAWNGKGIIPQQEHGKLTDIVNAAHDKFKPVRFWAAPDFPNAWIKLMELGIDVINTDHVVDLANFLIQLPLKSYTSNGSYSIYTPLYDRERWRKTPKNIILMIGDGTGLAQWYSGYTANRGALNIFQLTDVGLSITSSADNYITDSAAGATAMATGSKTNNRFVGVDTTGRTLNTIAEAFKKKKFKVAIISNGDVTDATPASFYAHKKERSMSEEIALDFVTSDIDILVGGGEKAFMKRKDGRNLMTELSGKTYEVSNTFRSIDAVKSSRFVIIEDSAVVSKQKGRGDFLSRSLVKSLAVLSAQTQPFLIMEEGAQIDWGGHGNNMEYVVREVLDFDQAIGEAIKFVDNNNETLLVITADHETGGLTLLGGNVSKGFVMGKFSTNNHTGIAVPVFSYGPGAEHFRGVYQNTEIYKKLMTLISLH